MRFSGVIYFSIIFSLGATRECPGTESFLSASNVEQFQNCTHVNGNIIINLQSLQGDTTTGESPISLDQLSFLSDIREITGYLLIQELDHTNLTNLRFLRNLRTIHGRETLQLLPGQHYSLVVTENQHLRTLNFASLQSIMNGGVRITSNPQLCLVDTISVEELLVNSDLRRVGGLAWDCTSVVCHEQCLVSEGCWGVLADECVQCRHYDYKGTCVESCDMSVSQVDEGSMMCVPLKPPSEHTTPIPQYTTTDHRGQFTTTELQNNPTQSTQQVTDDITTQIFHTGTPSIFTQEATLSTDIDLSFTPTWLIAVCVVTASIAVVILVLLVIVSAACLYQRWRRKTQHQSLVIKQSVKDGEGCVDTDCIDKSRDKKTGSLRRQHISIGSLATSLNGHKGVTQSDKKVDILTIEGTTMGDVIEASHDQQSSSHDNHMTPTNHIPIANTSIYLQTPNRSPQFNNHHHHHHQRTHSGGTTPHLNTPSPPNDSDPVIRAHINNYASIASQSATWGHKNSSSGSLTPSPSLRPHHHQHHTQRPTTMGTGWVYRTSHSPSHSHHSHRTSLGSSHGTNSRMSQRYSRGSSGSAVSSVRTMVSGHNSINSIVTSLE